jgi:hypothetical protein
MGSLLDARDEGDRLAIAGQLYARYRADCAGRGENMARSRLVAGIQVALRDAVEGTRTASPHQPVEQLER